MKAESERISFSCCDATTSVPHNNQCWLVRCATFAAVKVFWALCDDIYKCACYYNGYRGLDIICR
jgi:hypothetical protein